MKKFLLPLIASLFFAAGAQGAELQSITIRRADGRTVIFQVIPAVDDISRATGLMNITELPQDQGMIFLYEKPMAVQFWMKNTLIPLDMVFFNKKGEITHIEASAKPESLEARGPNRSDTCAVLEINGGAAAFQGLKVGDKLLFNDDSACLP